MIKYLITFFLTLTSFSQNNLTINFINSGPISFDIDQINEIKIINDVIQVEGLTIDQEDLEINVDDKLQLSYTITPENSSNKNVSWLSSNSEVVTIDQSGLLSALSQGDATITVTSEEGNFSDEIGVKVINVNSIKLNEDQIKIYPNPAQDILNIELKNKQSFEVIISDIEGRVLYSDYDESQIKLQKLNSGTYFITLRVQNNYYNYQIIKN